MAEHDRVFVTGASGYLGGHIMRLLGDRGVAVPRNQYAMCRGQTVIHCAAVVPKTEQEAEDWGAAGFSVGLVDHLLRTSPAFVVFASTRETLGAYAEGKRKAEALLRHTPATVIRFPGLFGPPKNRGLLYTAARAILAGQRFTPDHPLPDWTAMPVTEAAQLCVELADRKEPGLTVARNAAIEAFLGWVRA